MRMSLCEPQPSCSASPWLQASSHEVSLFYLPQDVMALPTWLMSDKRVGKLSAISFSLFGSVGAYKLP